MTANVFSFIIRITEIDFHLLSNSEKYDRLIVVTIFLLILNQMEFRLVHNQKKNSQCGSVIAPVLRQVIKLVIITGDNWRKINASGATDKFSKISSYGIGILYCFSCVTFGYNINLFRYIILI